MKTSRWIAAVLVVALCSVGPLAPMVSLAQAQTMQPAPPPMAPATPAPPIEPPLTNQIPGEEVKPVDPPSSMLMPSADPVTNLEPTPGDATAAGFMNVVYVPGKAIICTAGVLTSTLLMILTFGSAYRQARGVFMEGCSSPWALTADHVSGKIPGPGDSGYDPSGRY